MNTLSPGTEGDDVSKLQARLAELGFPPGKIDGDFGPGTEAALQQGDLAQARRLVNGGSNGLDRFKDCYQRGLSVLANA